MHFGRENRNTTIEYSWEPGILPCVSPHFTVGETNLPPVSWVTTDEVVNITYIWLIAKPVFSTTHRSMYILHNGLRKVPLCDISYLKLSRKLLFWLGRLHLCPDRPLDALITCLLGHDALLTVFAFHIQKMNVFSFSKETPVYGSS